MPATSSPVEWATTLQKQGPVRVLAVVYPANALFPESQPSAVQQEALASLRPDAAHLNILLVQTWPNRTLLVFDINHYEYDFDHAHHPETIDVIAIHLRGSKQAKVGLLREEERHRVNCEVAHMHDLNGWARPPFTEDHRNGNVPNYPNTRAVSGDPLLYSL